MKSLSTFFGAAVLSTSLSLAHSAENSVISNEATRDTSKKITEQVQSDANKILLAPSSKNDLPMYDKKTLDLWRNGVRTPLTSDSQFIIGNSHGLRLGFEFNMNTKKSEKNTFNDSRVGVGILKHGLGVQWVAKF